MRVPWTSVYPGFLKCCLNLVIPAPREAFLVPDFSSGVRVLGFLKDGLKEGIECRGLFFATVPPGAFSHSAVGPGSPWSSSFLSSRPSCPLPDLTPFLPLCLASVIWQSLPSYFLEGKKA